MPTSQYRDMDDESRFRADESSPGLALGRSRVFIGNRADSGPFAPGPAILAWVLMSTFLWAAVVALWRSA
jgi:hypothetical protein